MISSPLRAGQSSGAEYGYPLSRYLRQHTEGALSWEARELACHFVDAYHDRLLSMSSQLVYKCRINVLQNDGMYMYYILYNFI